MLVFTIRNGWLEYAALVMMGRAPAGVGFGVDDIHVTSALISATFRTSEMSRSVLARMSYLSFTQRVGGNSFSRYVPQPSGSLNSHSALPSLPAMQMKFSKSVATLVAAMISVSLASAHPGHAPTDPVAQVSQPLAGADHFAAFLALTSILLLTVRAVRKHRADKKETARK
jgi:hypothetical protein